MCVCVGFCARVCVCVPQGKVTPPPEIVAAVAASGKTVQGGYGPGDNDTVTVVMSKIIDSPPIGTQAQVDAMIQFVPPLVDVNYTGCVALSSLLVMKWLSMW